MELVSFAKELLHATAEFVASYRVGQSALRCADKALWTVEKSARWAVPPPLEQDEGDPDLVRPLPWALFLMLLVALRVTRESISLINLLLGKPPLRSADMVTYIQGKRRYLRALKYQGSRTMRARSEPKSWRSGIYSLLEFTMCFRNSRCGNNNSQSSGDELVMVSGNEASMERLLKKMVKVEADFDSCETLTNTKSDSETTEDSKELIVTSTPEKKEATLGLEDVSGMQESQVEALLSFMQHESNGQLPACSLGVARPAHPSPGRGSLKAN